MPIVGGLIGKTFGSLKVIAQAGRGPRGVSYRCRCVCGKIIKRTTTQLTGMGQSLSCGCQHSKADPNLRKREPILKNLLHLKSTIACWKNMLSRGYYGKNRQDCYKHVTVCDRWFSFANFLEDMGERPSTEHTIDRKKPELGYFKENCQWLTKSENAAKTRWWQSIEAKSRKTGDSLRKGYAEGRLSISPERKKQIAKGAIKRIGRKLQSCGECGSKSYLPVCQKCRMKAETEQKIKAAKERFAKLTT